GRVGVEVLAVDVHPGGVQAVHHGLVEGGAAAAHGVEHARAAGDQVHGGVARHGGDVQQKLGEVLVRLAGVLLDRQQIAAEQVEGLERDRTQQVALELEQRVERRQVGQKADVLFRQLVRGERHVRDAPDVPLFDVVDAPAES